MLILLTLFTFISTVRYTLSLSTSFPAVYACLLVVQQQCEAISYLLICWYFFSKTEKLLDDSSAMAHFIKIICILSVCSFVIIFVYQVQEVSQGHIATLCKTMFFIVPESFSELIVIAFVCLGIKLTRVFHELKLHQLRNLAPTDDEDYAFKVRAQISLRDYALYRMWFIIASLTLASTYTLVYSIMLADLAETSTCRFNLKH
jgi:hypothetical protein